MILCVELLARCPQIPFRVPVSLQVAIHSHCHHKHSDVKLSIFVQKRLFYVLLYYVGSLECVLLLLFDDILYLRNIFADTDPYASI